MIFHSKCNECRFQKISINDNFHFRTENSIDTSSNLMLVRVVSLGSMSLVEQSSFFLILSPIRGVELSMCQRTRHSSLTLLEILLCLPEKSSDIRLCRKCISLWKKQICCKTVEEKLKGWQGMGEWQWHVLWHLSVAPLSSLCLLCFSLAHFSYLSLDSLCRVCLSPLCLIAPLALFTLYAMILSLMCLSSLSLSLSLSCFPLSPLISFSRYPCLPHRCLSLCMSLSPRVSQLSLYFAFLSPFACLSAPSTRGKKRDSSTSEYEVKYKRSTGGVQEEYALLESCFSPLARPSPFSLFLRASLSLRLSLCCVYFSCHYLRLPLSSVCLSPFSIFALPFLSPCFVSLTWLSSRRERRERKMGGEAGKRQRERRDFHSPIPSHNFNFPNNYFAANLLLPKANEFAAKSNIASFLWQTH